MKYKTSWPAGGFVLFCIEIKLSAKVEGGFPRLWPSKFFRCEFRKWLKTASTGGGHLKLCPMQMICNRQKRADWKYVFYTGIIIDQHLTWKNHIDYITKKIIRTTGFFCRIRLYVNQTHLKMLYNSLNYPYLHYGNIVWANNYPTRLDKLFKLQKKVLRIITFSSYTAPSLPLFTQLNLLNIYQINDFLIGSFSFSLSNKVLPLYFSDFCLENAQVHEYNTRNSKQLHKTYNRTNYGKYSTRNKIIDFWNRIPLFIKHSVSLKIFKKKLKQYILSLAAIAQ